MRRGMTGKRGWLWMALVAVWLTVLAPTVSRTAAAAFALPDLGAWCEPVGHHHEDGASAHTDEDAACGYCTLFASTPTLGGGAFVAGVPFIAGPVKTAGPPLPRAATASFFPTHPRGPPVVVTA